MLPLGIASKVGFQPETKAILVAVSTSPPKQPPVVGPWQWKMVGICDALVGLCFILGVICIGDNL
jgi:hypothetical protein